mmetsp:Transcript_110696/g.352568  ORF Transcript_110696/g.352568 Transcript_110696/m.352568 type:complete len:311 (+) Transcript_110696:654-1586(+)
MRIRGRVDEYRSLPADVPAEVGVRAEVGALHCDPVHQAVDDALPQLQRLCRRRRLQLQGQLQGLAQGVQGEATLQECAELLHQAVRLADVAAVDAVRPAEGLGHLVAAAHGPGIAAHEPQQALGVVPECAPAWRIVLLWGIQQPLPRLSPRPLELVFATGGLLLVVLIRQIAERLPSGEVANRQSRNNRTHVADDAILHVLARSDRTQQHLPISRRNRQGRETKAQLRTAHRGFPSRFSRVAIIIDGAQRPQAAYGGGDALGGGGRWPGEDIESRHAQEGDEQKHRVHRRVQDRDGRELMEVVLVERRGV